MAAAAPEDFDDGDIREAAPCHRRARSRSRSPHRGPRDRSASPQGVDDVKGADEGKRTRAMMITINKDDDLADDLFKTRVKNLFELNQLPGLRKWVYQFERGAEENRLHAHMALCFNQGKTYRRLRARMVRISRSVNIKRITDKLGAFKYCSKVATRDEGPWKSGLLLGLETFFEGDTDCDTSDY